MNYIYQLTFDPSKVDIQLLAIFLTDRPQIKNWRVPPFPATVFIVSDLALEPLNQLIGGHMGGLTYLLTYIPNKFITGLCDQGTWDFINNPPVPPSNTVPKFGGALGAFGSAPYPKHLDYRPTLADTLGNVFGKKD
jgi:hypothetical protein